MSNSIKVSSCIQLKQSIRNTGFRGHSSNGFLPILQNFSVSQIRTANFFKNSVIIQKKVNSGIRIQGTISEPDTWNLDGPSLEIDTPVSIELKSIVSEEQFDRIIAEAQQLEESVIIVWMASWCRKCIYLKPKLEKMAANYYPRVGFYCIDVNTVPYKLVNRAGVTKMPTIQLWKDGKKQAEVIGGHKAYLVVNEVCEMIDNEGSL